MKFADIYRMEINQQYFCPLLPWDWLTKAFGHMMLLCIKIAATDDSQLVSTTINRAQKLPHHLSPSTEILVIIQNYCLSVDTQTWNNSLLLHGDSFIAAKCFFDQYKSSLDSLFFTIFNLLFNSGFRVGVIFWFLSREH